MFPHVYLLYPYCGSKKKKSQKEEKPVGQAESPPPHPLSQGMDWSLISLIVAHGVKTPVSRQCSMGVVIEQHISVIVIC